MPRSFKEELILGTDRENVPPAEEKTEKQEKAFVTGQSCKNKKHKRSPIVIVVIFLLLCVMGFSAYKIIDQLLVYKRGQDAYNQLRKDIVQLQTDQQENQITTTAWTVPASEPTMPPTLEPETANPAETVNPDQAESRERPGQASDHFRGDITYDPAETYAGIQVIPNLAINFDSLKAQNPDTRAWLYGMDGIVNYPVVQGADNDYYSHRLLDGKEQFCGTLFIDCRNNFLEDDITYIYGHKMKDGSMFGHFGKYDTYAYYASHPTFRLFTPDGTYELQVVACVYTTKWEPLRFKFADQQDFNNTIANYRRRSTFQTAVETNYGDHLVALWTCAYYREDGRMFILCKAVQVQ